MLTVYLHMKVGKSLFANHESSYLNQVLGKVRCKIDLTTKAMTRSLREMLGVFYRVLFYR
jgi:hypothetical protein